MVDPQEAELLRCRAHARRGVTPGEPHPIPTLSNALALALRVLHLVGGLSTDQHWAFSSVMSAA